MTACETELSSLQQASWLNFFLCMTDKDVLKVGTRRTDNIHIIASSHPRSLTCIGDLSVELHTLSIKSYAVIEDAPSKSFDVLVVDEPEYFGSVSSLREMQKVFVGMTRILRDDGVVLLCFKNRPLWALRYRYWVKKSLLYVGLHSAWFFWCDPSAEYPGTIIPCVGGSRWLVLQLPDTGARVHSLGERVKDLLKRLIFQATDIYNPFRGLMVIAGKSAQDIPYHYRAVKSAVDEWLRAQKEEDGIKLFATFQTRGPRQMVFVYNALDDTLLLIIKIENTTLSGGENTKKEHENLLTLAECRSVFAARGVRVPDPVYFEMVSERVVSVQSAVPGTSVCKELKRYIQCGDRESFSQRLDEVLAVQSVLQGVCTKKASHAVACVPQEWFDDYLHLPIEWGGAGSDLSVYSKDVQHGDFTTVNILYDQETQQWGVIDWEWMAVGYPPLFDFFSCFTSIGFMGGEARSTSIVDDSYHSYIQTYFCRNWFSEYVRQRVESCCDDVRLNRQIIYPSFLMYLIYHCNKYKHYYELPQYRRLYERMLIYAVNNKAMFVIG